jgi:hypothetical protein
LRIKKTLGHQKNSGASKKLWGIKKNLGYQSQMTPASHLTTQIATRLLDSR